VLFLSMLVDTASASQSSIDVWATSWPRNLAFVDNTVPAGAR